MIKVPITNWRKSSYSSTDAGTDCVETGWAAGLVGYRDSKDLAGASLVFPRGAARQFLAIVCRGADIKPQRQA